MEENPHLKNVEIATEYKIGESTVSEILKSKDRWLAVDESSYRRIVEKSIAAKIQTCLEDFINFERNRMERTEVFSL